MQAGQYKREQGRSNVVGRTWIMKKTIISRLAVIIFMSMLVILGLNLFLKKESATRSMLKNSLIKLNQIEQIVEHNRKDTELVKKGMEADYIIRAKAAAYIVQKFPEVTEDLAEMEKIADLLQVDEFHLFDKEGRIYSGTKPEYYGYTFESGEQMEFFLPMLEDQTLSLCQEITENTAEGKLMQYAAVWQEDGERIVQIGMNPEHMLEVMRKNELTHIFSMVTYESGTVIYAVNRSDGTILGSTEEELHGKKAQEIGLKILEEKADAETGFGAVINGIKSYCVFRTVGDMYIGISQEESVMFESLRPRLVTLVICLSAISLVMILSILRQLDWLILQGLNRINTRVALITQGNLDTVVDVSNTEEFRFLSENINAMVSSLLGTTNKLSQLFDSVELGIGVYEYHDNMKRVLATRKIDGLLMLTETQRRYVLDDRQAFERCLEELRSRPVAGMRDTYRVSDYDERYVKVQSFETEGDTFGVIMDMTEEVLEKQRIEQERDYDLLTGLLSRRAFYDRMKRLFEQPDDLGCAVLLMADVDHLKTANDTYGHAFGDRLIRAAAEIIAGEEEEHKLVSRLSGDEFVLFLYGAESQAELKQYIREIDKRMRECSLTLPDGGAYPVRVSAGYVFFPECKENFSELIRFADRAMYQVKHGSRGGFCAYKNTILHGGEQTEE